MNDLFSAQSRRRLLRHAREQLATRNRGRINPKQTLFLERFDANAPALLESLLALYGDQADFAYAFQELCNTLATSWANRPDALRELDLFREQNPRWFVSETMAGAVCYVDLWAGTFEGLEKKIPYLQSLGITYLHLMPVFRTPESENDGGYAVSSYRETASHLGTFDGLRHLMQRLREAGIVTVLDFINNHTANDHIWAQKAAAGEHPYDEFYFLFDDRTWPDRFGKTLREIFPEVRRGCFSHDERMNRWVWTTFHDYQWDLNYRNPHLFAAMAGEMLHLANAGADILRLDAVPFVWKQEGTSCENLDEAHTLVEALNLCARIAAPGLLFKSEAIVHPDDVIRYVTPSKCQLSYNPTVMATLWEALATRNTTLLRSSIRHRFGLPEGTSWVNYVRSHDDIGWTFSDEDAYDAGIDPGGHRAFLNQFYSGRFDGSFAKGRTFQHNPENGDMRICGTAASLCGVERGLELQDEAWLRDGVARLILLYGVAMSVGGIPLLYLGDEWATLNDDSYLQDPAKRADARWVHRVRMDWERTGPGTVLSGSSSQAHEATFSGEYPTDTSSADMHERASHAVFQALQSMLRIRSKIPAFARNQIQVIDLPDPSLLLYRKGEEEEKAAPHTNMPDTQPHDAQPSDAFPHDAHPHNTCPVVWVAANVSEHPCTLPARSLTSTSESKMADSSTAAFTDLLCGESFSRDDVILLGPCQIRWLTMART